jgi:DNA-binding CsgD family transcriptional regulator
VFLESRVGWHRAAVMHKLKLNTTAELVLYAVRNHMVQP